MARTPTVDVVLIALVTAAALVANTAFVWPQAVKLARRRDVTGVSPGTWTISIILFSVWAAFAAATGYWPLFMANVSCFFAAVVVLAIGTKAGWPARWALLSTAGVGAAILAGLWMPGVLAVVMTVAGVAMRAPQVLLLVRSSSVAGVSGVTWMLSAATAGGWLVVSMSRGATAVVVANATALAATVLLLAVLGVRRRQAWPGRSPVLAALTTAAPAEPTLPAPRC